MPEQHTLYVAPASAACRAVLLHHRLLHSPALDIVEIDLSKGEQHSDEFLRQNPLHCVPTLITPWGPLWESRAIMRYFESIIPDPVLYPSLVYHRAVVDRLLDWDLGTLYRAVSSVVYPQVFSDKEPTADELDRVAAAVRFLDKDQLGDGRAFLTGDLLTIADLSCSMTLSLLRLIDLEIDELPYLTAWQARVAQIDGASEVDAPFQAWVEHEAQKHGPETPNEAEESSVPAHEEPAAADEPEDAAAAGDAA